MKILVLEHPRITSEKRFNDIANTPLWSCLMGGYAAAALEREDFEVIFLDEAGPGSSFDRTKEKTLLLNPDLLCVNTVYFWENTPVLFDFFSELRTLGFQGHINLFGFFPSLVFRKILKTCDPVDSIAVGEFEHTLVELAESLKKGKSLETIEGLALKSCLKDNAGRMRTPKKNPDVFAFPKRSSLEGTVTLLASRGCYNHCSFCPVPSFYNQGSLWQGRSPQNVSEEIKGLSAKGVTQFYFCDPNFIGPGAKGKKRILDLMDLIKPLHIKFGMETRPQDLDDDILKKLVDAGLESLLMGVESGSPDILGRIDKRSVPAQSSRAIELCRKHGIEPEIGFLMFVPDSSIHDLKENLAFLMENRLLDRLERTANLLCHTQIVLAGTSGYQRFEKLGRLNKSGIFEFEAEADFSDPAVKWVAALLTVACHTVLKNMSDSFSPIFWENPDNTISQTVNDYLIRLSYTLIDQALEGQVNLHPENIEQRKQELMDKINSMIKKWG